MKKILVVGGAGYIGLPTIDELLKKKYKVVCIDNLLYGKTANLDVYKKNKNFIFYKKDFSDKKLLTSLFNQGYKTVIFLASVVGDPITKKYPKIANKIMLSKTKIFINLCKKNNIEKFFFASTCSNYGLSKSNKLLGESSPLKPLSLYAKNKVQIEKFLINQTKLNYTILRFSTAFGVSKRMRFDLTVNEFVKTVFFKKHLLVYDSDTYRPYLHTKDFARLFDILIKSKKDIKSKIYNVGGDKNNFSKRALIKKINKIIKINNLEFKDMGTDKRNYKVSFKKIKKDLNFTPKYSINYGIMEILDYLNKSNKSYQKLKMLGNYKIKNEN